MTIKGSDFEPTATVKLEYSVGDVITGTSVQWVDSKTLTADFDLAGATLGFYDVIVTNPLMPPGVLEDGFEVKEPFPIVESIDPNWGYQDELITGVTVKGANFLPAAIVELEYDVGDKITGTSVQWVDSKTLTADFDLAGATLGFYDVIVTNPLMPPGVLEDGFEVKEAPIFPIWPVTSGNSMHTGMIGINGPSGYDSNPKWKFTYPEVGWGNAFPVFLNETTAFFSIAGMADKFCPAVAVNLSSQTLKWSKAIPVGNESSTIVLGLSADGKVVFTWVYPKADVYGLDAETGSIIWGPLYVASLTSISFPAHDQNGNFIMPGESSFYSIEPNTGYINWSVTIGDPGYCIPAVGTDGTIYVYVEKGMFDGQVHALDPNTGKDKWSKFPAVGITSNGIVFNPVTQGIILHGKDGLFCFKDNGTSYSEMWKQSYKCSYYGSSAVAKNGDIYLIDGDGILRRLNPYTGETINSSSGYSGGYGAMPAIGKNGLIYINNEAYFRCFNPDCTLRWSIFTSWTSYWSAPAIHPDGTVYSVRRNDGLCAWHD